MSKVQLAPNRVAKLLKAFLVLPRRTGAEVLLGNGQILKRDAYIIASTYIEDTRASFLARRGAADCPVACPCIRVGLADRVHTCKAATTGYRPYNDCYDDWPGPTTDENRQGDIADDPIFFCLCGQESKSHTEREAHVYTAMDGAMHGIPPDELVQMGAAYVLVNRNTGDIVECDCFRLPNRSIGVDHSTAAEARAMVEMLRQWVSTATTHDGHESAKEVTPAANAHEPALGSQEPAPTHPRTHEGCWSNKRVILFTDNESTVAAAQNHIPASQTTWSKRSKLGIADELRNLDALVQTVVQCGGKVTFKHDHNEHGRAWQRDRQTLPCRLNRACDLAAGEAACFEGFTSEDEESADNGVVRAERGESGGRFADERNETDDGTGSPTMVMINELKFENDPRALIRVALAAQHLAYVISGDGIQGVTPRLHVRGSLSTQTSEMAKMLMSDGAYHEAALALLHQSRVSMQTVKGNAKYADGGTMAHYMFAACGPLHNACPFCARLGDNGCILRDSHHHARFDCSSLTPQRQFIDASFSERLCREGRCWHVFGPEEPGAVGAFTSDDPQFNEARTRRRQPTLGGVTWSENSDSATLLKGRSQQMVVAGARVRCIAAGVLQRLH